MSIINPTKSGNSLVLSTSHNTTLSTEELLTYLLEAIDAARSDGWKLSGGITSFTIHGANRFCVLFTKD